MEADDGEIDLRSDRKEVVTYRTDAGGLDFASPCDPASLSLLSQRKKRDRSVSRCLMSHVFLSTFSSC